MEQKGNENGRHVRISRFRWVIGTPYFVQGTSTLTEVPILYFIKFTLQMGDAGGQLFDALRQTGWFIKPLWGIISDKVPIFGYHRKSWYILMAFAATFFWKFSPSVGYIERSYLIDVRGFTAASFGTILAVGGVTFFVSVLVYSWFVRQFPETQWYQYLYAMVALGVVALPLSFYLYLDPDHPWWKLIEFTLPAWLNPLPHWNHYQWFRLLLQTTLGFATIPAFIIPLTLAGETVNLAYAGVSYAFLMSLSNATNMFEGVVGAGLYNMFSHPPFNRLVALFGNTFLNIAHTDDERTLILQMFVYISLIFTLLTIPFIEMLRRELARRKVDINLGRRRE
jgi:hypothetical protein